jgi:hypothetical protein
MDEVKNETVGDAAIYFDGHRLRQIPTRNRKINAISKGGHVNEVP